MFSRPPLLHERTSNKSEGNASQRSALNHVSCYLGSLFRFTSWIRRYDSTWLASDLIAGITVAAILVPQGMAYASLANLDPEFGLYSSFVGVMLYWLFGTSKDISIGPVAVLSTVVGNLVSEVHATDPKIAPYAVAASLSILTGVIVLVMGLLRCGWIVNLVSAPALAAFMTGSAISITMSQVPTILGLTGFSARESPYKVFVNIITRLDKANLNAVLGLSALVFLYLTRAVLATAAERSHKHRQALQFANSMRSVSVIIFFTVISWLIHWTYERETLFLFDVLGNIPQGFQHLSPPPIHISLFANIISYVPATIVVMLVEHMAIAKSFGRANNYSINPSQEMVAIGVTNLIGPFFGAYASTGSFSRTAIQSKAGARSPMAGLVTGLVVLLAIHLLTSAFYYIPSAVLSAVVVHAVGDLITPMSTIRQYWLASPAELLVFLVGVLASIAKSIETGLYASVSLSTAVLLYRYARLQSPDTQLHLTLPLAQYPENGKPESAGAGRYGTFGDTTSKNLLDFDHNGMSGANAAEIARPGVILYRFPTILDYINAAGLTEELVRFTHDHTISSAQIAPVVKTRGPFAPSESETILVQQETNLVPLKAVVLDFLRVRGADATAIQQIVDLKKQLNAYALPDGVELHFMRIRNPRLLRALQGAGLIESEDEDQAPGTDLAIP